MACLSRAACVGAAFLPAASFRTGCTRKHLQAQGRPHCAGPIAAAAGTSPLAEPAPKFAALPAEQQRRVDAYLDLLLDWNQRMNLTGTRCRGQAAGSDASSPPLSSTPCRCSWYPVQPSGTARRPTSGTSTTALRSCQHSTAASQRSSEKVWATSLPDRRAAAPGSGAGGPPAAAAAMVGRLSRLALEQQERQRGSSMSARVRVCPA